jgi:tetratricopeptide (TPR) repeat protein
MHRLYFLFLFQFVLFGKTLGQNSFDQQHEKFIHTQRDENSGTLLKILQTEEKLLLENSKPTNTEKAKLALDRGTYFYTIDECEKAIISFKKALNLNGLKSNRDKIILYTHLGTCYGYGPEDQIKSHQYLDKAIELAQKEKMDDLFASAVLKKSDNYYSRGKFAEGVRLVEPLLQRKSLVLSFRRRSYLHASLARGYDELGNFKKSHFHFTSAIELAEKTKDVRLIADRNFNFIGYFLQKERFGEAKLQTFKVIRLVKDKPELEEILYDCYAALGQIYSCLNKLDSALYYCEISHKYALKTGDKGGLVISYHALGRVYYDKEEYEKALRYTLKSLEYEKQIDGVKDLGGAYLNIGTIYLRLRNYPQAVAYLNMSRKRAYREKDIYAIYLSYNNLVEVYRESGDYKQAITMYDSTYLYFERVNNLQRDQELLQQEVRYKTRLKDKENKLLKLQVRSNAELLEKAKEQRRNMIFLSVFLILGLSGVIYVLFIQNKLRKSKVSEANTKLRNQKLEKELLNQRLNLLTEEINRKNQLIHSLEKDASTMTEENLLNKVTLENDWLAFMSEFDKMHKGYLSTLKQRFPELTINNLRLAALVKLEFSNKEIANILCITENGVKKAKQRLKERIRQENENENENGNGDW